MSKVRDELEIPRTTFDRLLERLKTRKPAEDTLVHDMQSAGVSLDLHGKGKPSYFVKRAA